MAFFIKHTLTLFFLLCSLSSAGHTIYAPNDIPLLDNRFRIDPETDQITFILNHSKGSKRVILVQPDGHKIYQQRHGNDVGWVSSKVETIITIQKPMAGPWQVLATLDGNNRIKLISKVRLEVRQLPLKLYAHEYITTYVALYEGKQLLKKPVYLKDAQLSISLIGGANKKISLYQDDGRHYDQLAFDGELTTRFYVDLQPGRYLLSIRTKNDVFIRNVNKDAVIFPTPINYEIDLQNDEAEITFTVDSDEIAPNSVSIKGAIKNAKNRVIKEVIIHNMDNTPSTEEFSGTYKLSPQMYTFSGKVFATTLTGREVELQLTERIFNIVPAFKMPEIQVSEIIPTQAEQTTLHDEIAPASLMSNIWVIITIVISLLLLIAGVIFFIIKMKNKKNSSIMDDLNLEELQPTSIDIKGDK